MKFIRALIIDHEPLAVQRLSDLIQNHYPAIQVVGKAGNIADGLKMTEKYTPELIFLDIQLTHNGSGFEYLEKIRKNLDPGIVVTTAHTQLAIQAINTAQPWGYLIKPVKQEELKRAIATTTEKITEKVFIKYYQHKRLTIPDQKNGAYIIAASDILYIQGESKLTKIVLMAGNKIVHRYTYKSLRELEDELPRHFFFRSHGSYIVNLLQVKNILYVNRGGIAQLPYNLSANIAVSRLDGFLSKMKELNVFEKNVRLTRNRSRSAEQESYEL